MNWKALLEVHSIKTPAGKTLRTLADARAHLLEMPETKATVQAAGIEGQAFEPPAKNPDHFVTLLKISA